MAATVDAPVQSGVDALRRLFAQLGAQPKAGADVRPGATSTSPGLDIEMLILADRLKDVVADAPELQPVLNSVQATIQSPQSTTTAADFARLERRVQQTNAWLFMSAPAIHANASLARANWTVAHNPIVDAAWTGKGLRADVVVKAWAGWSPDAAWADAETHDRHYPGSVVAAYLGVAWPSFPPAFPTQVGLVGGRYDELTTMLGSDRPTTPGYAELHLWDANGDPYDTAQYPIFVSLKATVDDFDGRLTSPAARDAAYAEVMAFSVKVQRYVTMLTALLVDLELIRWTSVSGLIPNPLLVSRLTGYHDEMTDIINKLAAGFQPNGGSQQTDGSKALSELLNRQAYKDDRDKAIFWKDLEDTVETIALGVAVGAAVALTAGAAGALAGEVLVVYLGEGVALTAGTMAVEATAMTLANRVYGDLIFGTGDVKHTPFWEELVTNAFLMGAGKVVSGALADCLKTAFEAESTAYKVTLVVSEQISMIAVGTVVQLLESEDAPQLRGVVVSVAQQALLGALLHVALRQSTKFSERHPDLAARIAVVDPTLVPALDQASVDLANLAKKHVDGTAVSADHLALAKQIEKQFNAELAALNKLPAADVAAQAARATLAQLKGEVGLLLAISGFEPAINPTGEPPPFQPAGPGIVTYTDEARPVIEKFVADKGGTLTELTDAPGVLKANMPSGPPLTFVPGKGAIKLKPTAKRIVAGRAAADQAVKVSDDATRGAANLSQLFGKTGIDKIYNAVDASRVAALLEFLAHPMFAEDAPDRGYGASDIIAFANSPEARWFATTVSPDLAVKIKVWGSGAVTTQFGNKSIGMMRRANAIIDETPASDRAALVSRWEGLGKDALLAELFVKEPSEPLFPKFDPDTFGVDRQSKEYASFLASEQAKATVRGDLSTLPPDKVKEALQARADIAQILERSREGKFTKWSYADQLELVNEFDKDGGLLETARFDTTIKGSLLRGGLVQRIVNKLWRPGVVWRFRGKSLITSGPSGYAEIDWATLINKVWHVTEIKSDLIHEMSEARARYVGGGYADDLVADLAEMPDDTIATAYYFRKPPPEIQAAIIDEYAKRLTSDTRPHQIQFGDQAPVPIKQP